MPTPSVDPSLQAIFKELNDEVIALSWKWQIVKGLFESKARIDILNQTAPIFFMACQMTFKDDIYLGLSRITDPIQSSGQKNLVIGLLLERLEQNEHPHLYGELTRLIEVAMEAHKPFKRHRHKRLAHNDLNTKLKFSTEPLPGITAVEVNRAVKSLQDVLNAFNRYFFDKETHFTIFESKSVKALFVYLRKGIETFEKEKQQTLGAHGIPSD